MGVMKKLAYQKNQREAQLQPTRYLYSEHERVKMKKDAHELCLEFYGNKRKESDYMKVKKKMKSGQANMSNEIGGLLKQKDSALAAGNTSEARKIRKTLRKLGYKRVLAKDEEKKPSPAPKSKKKHKKEKSKKKVRKESKTAHQDDDEDDEDVVV